MKIKKEYGIKIYHEVLGETVTELKSFGDYKIDEMVTLMNHVQEFAADWGAVLTNPDDAGRI